MSDAWGNFFVAQVGASAALLGLLFVSVSLNLSKIIASPNLTKRALLALLVLFNVLLVSSLLLTPEQTLRMIGIEILINVAIVGGIGCVLQVGSLHGNVQVGWPQKAVNAALYATIVLAYAIGGVLLVTGHPHGFYWIEAAILVSYLKAVADAWVLLVEINR